jgi:dihydroflavonol-4-reductase
LFDDLSASFVYGDSKHRAEDEVRAAVAQGLDAVMVNPAVVIGAGDHHLISGSLLIEMNRGWLPGIPPGGVCMVDVDAVVQGHLAAAERGRAGERYILGGENLSDRQVAETIADVLGKRAPVLTLPRWSLNPIAAAFDAFNRVSPWPPVVSGEQIRLMGYDIYYDSSKAVRELGYSILPFRGAVAKALRWYKEHGYL